MKKKYRIFLDTSVIFAAVISKKWGARKIFRLGEAGVIDLVISPCVLRESEQVVRRKVPTSLPILAQLLDVCNLEIVMVSNDELIEQAKKIMDYQPDIYVLAEAMNTSVDWFITHDKKHFLNNPLN